MYNFDELLKSYNSGITIDILTERHDNYTHYKNMMYIISAVFLLLVYGNTIEKINCRDLKQCIVRWEILYLSHSTVLSLAISNGLIFNGVTKIYHQTFYTIMIGMEKKI